MIEDVANCGIPLHGLCAEGVTTDDDLIDVRTGNEVSQLVGVTKKEQKEERAEGGNNRRRREQKEKRVEGGESRTR